MRAVDIIRRKRDGGELTAGEIAFLIDGYCRGDIPDYQMSAFAMAVLLPGDDRGRDGGADAGDGPAPASELDLAGIRASRWTSTAPVASATRRRSSSCRWPRRRRAGGEDVRPRARTHRRHAGQARIDPGLPHGLTPRSSSARSGEIGRPSPARRGDLAPADKKLYALRDVTGTVESIPLIARPS